MQCSMNGRSHDSAMNETARAQSALYPGSATLALQNWLRLGWLRFDLRYIIDLDDPRIGCHLIWRNEFIRNKVWTILLLILKQAMLDRARALHLLLDRDDDCVRFDYYVLVPEGHSPPAEQVPSDGADPDRFAWYAMMPAPFRAGADLFGYLREHAGMSPAAEEGILRVRWNGHTREFAVHAPGRTDFRLYFDDSRPAVCEKNARRPC